MKLRQLRNVFFGVNETFPHKTYNDNGSLTLNYQLRDHVDSVEVGLEETLKKEALDRYQPGVKILPAKIIYILPNTDLLADTARFIVINPKNRNIEQNDSIKIENIVEDLEKRIGKIHKNLYPIGIAIDEKTWIEIYTTNDPIFSKRLDYRGKHFIDLVKEIIQHDSKDMKRQLNRAAYELGRAIRIAR